MNPVTTALTNLKTQLFQIRAQHPQLLWILAFAAVLFLPTVGSFFSGDDWFHLKVAQITSLREFLNFFNPVFNPQSISFYRPIPTQLFFFVFYQLFGLWAVPYHLAMFGLFLTSIILLYRILLKLGFTQAMASVASFIFGFSHTHFTRLNFLSAGQEIMMSVFFLAGLWLNLSRKPGWATYFKTAGFFALALLSKETAVVFPVIVVVLDWLQTRRFNWLKLAILGAVAAVYLVIRFVIFNSPLTEIAAYQLDFSPRMAVNTVYFYGLWAVGGAELLQDYMSSPVTLIDRYFSDFGVLGITMLALLLSAIALIIYAFVTTRFKKLALLALLLFGVTLSPVLFLPLHKFTIEMTLPMMCFAAFLAVIGRRQPRWLISSLLGILLVLNLTTIYLTSRTHYSVQRSQISWQVYDFFRSHHPQLPTTAYFVVLNANTQGSTITEWGSSRQISLALWGDNFVKVVYQQPAAQMFFEDIPFDPPIDKHPVYLDASALMP